MGRKTIFAEKIKKYIFFVLFFQKSVIKNGDTVIAANDIDVISIDKLSNQKWKVSDFCRLINLNSGKILTILFMLCDKCFSKIW